jgi:two-component system response regulator CpxR
MSLRHRVLLVEDNKMLTDLLREILDEDYEVVCAGTVEQALVEIAGHPTDLVLLDFSLSDGDGQKVAEYSSRVSVPVIWMTGDPEAVRNILGNSQILLAKPFGIPVLRKTLAETLACR